MTQFQFTHSLLYVPNPATGQLKTLTSRLVHSEPDGTSVRGEMIQFPNGIPTVVRGDGVKWVVKWQVGKDYAIQPGRGMKATGRYQVLAIRRYDVRTITNDEARREGFINRYDFLRLWVSLYDKPVLDTWQEYLLAQRPDKRYDAWQISFKVTERYEAQS